MGKTRRAFKCEIQFKGSQSSHFKKPRQQTSMELAVSHPITIECFPDVIAVITGSVRFGCDVILDILINAKGFFSIISRVLIF